ncbi:MAG TPA: penicillin-binding transpeptidase domain-containing protein [Polyangiaceae bacterium]|nr:penicillin-binding transpeptidase domain-containing protein [Polyangiaceae bacterium]
MRRTSGLIGFGTALGLVLALVPVVRGNIDVSEPLRKLRPAAAEPVAPPSLDGLDLLRLDVRPTKVTAPLPQGRQAELTLDPVVQRTIHAEMEGYRIPRSGVVLMEVKTGKILAYSSYVAEGDKVDVNVRADAPAASVFKVVTGAALIEKAGLNPDTEQCYHGGKSRIAADELDDNPRRDKWCATLGIALGRSINVVFARLAQKHITPEDLTAVGGAFGFGAPIPFAVPNQAPELKLPADPVEFARSAAGFYHSTLSPLAAVELAQTVANGGVTLEPRIVAAVTKDRDVLWKDDRPPRALRRAIKPETAADLTRMMVQTVANGSAFKSFHDAAGTSFLGEVTVAGKTGTLGDAADASKLYTWFIGFAPVESPEVAVSALVVNNPSWQIKAPQLARDALRAYFARQGKKGVTAP